MNPSKLPPRDRVWIEINDLRTGQRIQIDANAIEGEPDVGRMKHTPRLDRSGQLWLPGHPSKVRWAS